jgi:hypothetical protein
MYAEIITDGGFISPGQLGWFAQARDKQRLRVNLFFISFLLQFEDYKYFHATELVETFYAKELLALLFLFIPKI